MSIWLRTGLARHRALLLPSRLKAPQRTGAGVWLLREVCCAGFSRCVARQRGVTAQTLSIEDGADAPRDWSRVGVMKNGEMLMWRDVNSESLDMTIDCPPESGGEGWYVVTLCCRSVYGETATRMPHRFSL